MNFSTIGRGKPNLHSRFRFVLEASRAWWICRFDATTLPYFARHSYMQHHLRSLLSKVGLLAACCFYFLPLHVTTKSLVCWGVLLTSYFKNTLVRIWSGRGPTYEFGGHLVLVRLLVSWVLIYARCLSDIRTMPLTK